MTPWTGELANKPWTGGLDWAAEVRRLCLIMQCRGTHHRRFMRHCAQLTPSRLQSPAMDRQALAAVLQLLESAAANGTRMPIGPYGPHRTGWTRADLGQLLVIARNRQLLFQLGRDRPKPKGPRFDPRRLPDDRLDWLVQRHPDMAVVDALRAERRRRQERKAA